MYLCLLIDNFCFKCENISEIFAFVYEKKRTKTLKCQKLDFNFTPLLLLFLLHNCKTINGKDDDIEAEEENIAHHKYTHAHTRSKQIKCR